MSRQVLIDTDIVIDFLRGERLAVAHLKSVADAACFSAVTVAETYAGIRGAREESEVERLFSLFTVLPVTPEMAREAGRFVQQYRPSHAVEIPDALIAAACVVSGAELHTLNVKHYPMFRDLKPPYRKPHKAGTVEPTRR